MYPWEALLSETDRQVILRGGYGQRRGLGRHPCLMVIDCQYNYLGDDKPIAEQLLDWPAGVGATAWRAVRNLQLLVNLAHDVGVPVIYTRNVQKHSLRFDSFAHKSRRDHSQSLEGRRGTEIVAQLCIQPDDLVIDKGYASVFFGTPIISYLTTLRVDSLLFTGVTTSGCVRASLIDAATHGFNAAVVEGCVADRIEVSHEVALLDIWMKYGDVMSLEEVTAYLRQITA